MLNFLSGKVKILFLLNDSMTLAEVGWCVGKNE
jgi:hypothetical protein